MTYSIKHGGYLAELPPAPYRREFNGKAGERRRIKVVINRFYGIGPHYYVSADEQSNPIQLSDGSYVLAWDDEEGRGRTWGLGRFAQYKAARRAADRFIEEWSKKPGYVIELDDWEDSLDEQDRITPEWD